MASTAAFLDITSIILYKTIVTAIVEVIAI
jgi:hypothetical protein